jgi:hypothetical protein
MLGPSASYSLLLAYQAQNLSEYSSSNNHGTNGQPRVISEYSHHRDTSPEWYELVDSSLLESLGSDEVKRQGLWWELIRLEREYVRDLRVICEVRLPAEFLYTRGEGAVSLTSSLSYRRFKIINPRLSTPLNVEPHSSPKSSPPFRASTKPT